MTSPLDTIQRSRTSSALSPITTSESKYNPLGPHAYYALQRIHRMASLPDLTSDPDHQQSYPPHRLSPFRQPPRDWDLYDDYWADRRYFMSPLAWPSESPNTSRRYYYFSPPYDLRWNYPALPWCPHGNRQIDLMERVDPLYTRRFRDPAYDKPAWKPARRWPHETGYRMDPRWMLQLYRQNLVDYDTLQRKWLTPFSLQRKIDEHQMGQRERQNKVGAGAGWR